MTLKTPLGGNSVDVCLMANVLHGFEGELDGDHHRNAKSGWRHEGLPWEQC